MKNIITAEQVRPLCVSCSKRLCRTNGKSKFGFVKYKKYCTICEKIVYNQKQNGRLLDYKLQKKNKCEKCGFVAEHHCQLDVDHIDGNKKKQQY